MIITRTPFRISFCGGGSDLPSFYEKNEGCVLSTTINKYMYISIHPYFESGKIALKYSQNEVVDQIEKVQHRIFKAVLKQYDINGVEITSTADIPAGTGLGSSSSFTVGLLNAVNAYTGKDVSKEELAQNACDIEINRLGSPIGKQDQYAAAFGGLNFIRFMNDGQTVVEPLMLKAETVKNFEDNLVMFYTGKKHDANTILAEQKNNMNRTDKTESLKRMCELTYDSKLALEKGDLNAFGEILHDNWMLKKQLASGISDSKIDDIYALALHNGARGGKLLGAGGGGFFLFYCEKENQERLQRAIELPLFPFKFENSGSSVVYSEYKCCD